MKAQIPQVVGYTHIFPPKVTLRVGSRLFSQHVAVVDPDFFQIIRLPLLAGSPARVFAQPDSIVLSQSMAAKLFGTATAMGRTVLVSGNYPLTVTGIIRDLPHNTQLKASVLFPNTSRADPFPEVARTNWEGLGTVLYVKLAPGSDPAQVLAMARRIIDHSINAQAFFGVDIPASEVFRPHLTPFVDGHLEDFGGARMTPGGSWTEIYGFGAIATLILLIACFNFTNLSTARATMRAREVSLRKVAGARRRQLIGQFLGESLVTAVIALVLALALVSVLTPSYDSFVGRPITLDLLHDWPVSLTIVAAALVTGFLGAFIQPLCCRASARPAPCMAAAQARAQGCSAAGW